MSLGLLKKILCCAFPLLFVYNLKTAYGSSDKKTLRLSEKEVLKEVLSASHFIKKIQAEKQKNLSKLLETKYSFSSWRLFSNWTQSQRNNPQIFVFESARDESKNWSLGIEKSLPYGSGFKSLFSYRNESKSLSDFLKSVQSPRQIYRKNLSLEWSASLTEALTQHWTLKTAHQGEKANEWLYYEKAEELALKSAGQYWTAYLAWITYIQTKESLKTYKKLVRQINSKKKYSFLNPGERPQILAEYENLKQLADKQQQIYENEQKALLLFLNRDPKLYKVQFTESPLSQAPHFPKINMDNMRVIKIKKQQIAEEEFQLKSQKAQLFPNLQFSAQGGLIPGSSSLDKLSFSKRHSFYELGVGFQWILFSRSFYEKVHQTKYQLEESKLDLVILKRKIKNKLSALEGEITAYWTNIHRADKANAYQKQAFRELKKSFEQGRVDVFELIHTENKLRESEVRKQTVRSEYSISLLQLLALRDQLVETYLKP